MEYRLSSAYNTELRQKGYKRSYQVIDEATQKTLAHSDVFGYVSHDAITVQNDLGDVATLAPNRKIMPSEWTLSDAKKLPLYTYARMSLVKAMNPFGRDVMTVTDALSARTFHLRNTTESKLDLLLGPSSTDWVLFEGDAVVGYLDRRKDPNAPLPGNKVLASLKRFMQSSDWVFVSTESEPALSASGYLILMLLFEELTKDTG
ncbi:hypothetical protein [Reinekea sp. G2M2-21]|uniref:hypothetical protein n=1 Tax=Reinekea sp. G2M2-21 TaxID=2788942 RepID=UPI0018AB7398|nr:hypothetical protein [Reinekea sp. G2M2-21]